MKFWDVRSNKQTNSIFGVQTCGHSIDMSKDNLTIVTGGGTGKEGLKVWDMRNLKEPKLQINWTQSG